MLVTVEDLKKGDVILVSSAKGIFEAKLLRQPCLAKRGSKTTWWGTPRWSSVLCAIREETTIRTYTNWQGTSQNYNYTKSVIADGKEYTREKRLNLTGDQFWLIKREEI